MSGEGLIADGDQWNVSWCGRGLDRPHLMRQSLGGPMAIGTFA